MILTNKRSQPLEAVSPAITAQQAVDYLSSHPDILLEHPRLLAELMLPFANNPASLVERQIQKLRAINEESTKNLHNQINDHQESIDLFEKTSIILATLMQYTHLSDFLQRLESQLYEHYCLLNCKLYIFNETVSKVTGSSDDYSSQGFFKALSFKPKAKLLALLEQHKIQAGPLRHSEQRLLFSRTYETCSAALIPLQSKTDIGLLALCHAEPLFFKPVNEFYYLTLLQHTLEKLLFKYINS